MVRFISELNLEIRRYFAQVFLTEVTRIYEESVSFNKTPKLRNDVISFFKHLITKRYRFFLIFKYKNREYKNLILFYAFELI